MLWIVHIYIYIIVKVTEKRQTEFDRASAARPLSAVAGGRVESGDKLTDEMGALASQVSKKTLDSFRIAILLQCHCSLQCSKHGSLY